MKRIIFAIAAAAMMTTAMAQDNNGQQARPEKKDRTEMIKFQTDATAKRLGLNEEQAKKLLELNTKYADKFRGPRMHGKGHRPGMRPGEGEKDAAGMTRPEPTEEQKQQMEEMRKQREEVNKEYEAELQKFLTPEQFKSYKEDMARRMKHGPRARMNAPKEKQE